METLTTSTNILPTIPKIDIPSTSTDNPSKNDIVLMDPPITSTNNPLTNPLIHTPSTSTDNPSRNDIDNLVQPEIQIEIQVDNTVGSTLNEIITTISIGVEAESSAPNRIPAPLLKMAAVASLAAGVQYGWALQLSLLMPYVQLLGVSHQWAANIWLCGPISDMVIQPLVGYYSDHCRSRFGRRRPFIFSVS
ncbi:hypothetical protein TSUD_249780 [Trifolium subterraneum]|nr:hypothetical protein TSUD_249780 [Trifolium subterraneum]